MAIKDGADCGNGAADNMPLFGLNFVTLAFILLKLDRAVGCFIGGKPIDLETEYMGISARFDPGFQVREFVPTVLASSGPKLTASQQYSPQSAIQNTSVYLKFFITFGNFLIIFLNNNLF